MTESEKADKETSLSSILRENMSLHHHNIQRRWKFTSPVFDLTDPSRKFVSTHHPVKPESGSNDEELVDEAELEIYKEEKKQFVRRKLHLYTHTEKTCGLIWGQ